MVLERAPGDEMRWSDPLGLQEVGYITTTWRRKKKENMGTNDVRVFKK